MPEDPPLSGSIFEPYHIYVIIAFDLRGMVLSRPRELQLTEMVSMPGKVGSTFGGQSLMPRINSVVAAIHAAVPLPPTIGQLVYLR